MKVYVLTQAVPDFDCYQASSNNDIGYYVMGAFTTYELANQAKTRLEAINNGYDHFTIRSVHVDDFLSIETMEEDYKRDIGDTE